MRISELIKDLEGHLDAFGDLQVYMEDFEEGDLNFITGVAAAKISKKSSTPFVVNWAPENPDSIILLS